MTLTPAVPPAPASPATPDRSGAESDLSNFPGVLGALSPRWSRMNALPMTTLLSIESGHAVSQAWDMVDEWGDQSFPASDPPSNW